MHDTSRGPVDGRIAARWAELDRKDRRTEELMGSVSGESSETSELGGLALPTEPRPWEKAQASAIGQTDLYAWAGYAGTLSSLAVRYTAVRRSVPCPWSSATFVPSVLSSAFCLSPRR